VVQVGAQPYSVVSQSPLAVFEPHANPFDDYVTAWQTLRTPSDYVAGFVAGYALLSGGSTPDVAVAKAASVIAAARIAHGSANYDTGAMDVWRVFVENPLDVQKVIDRI